jgi:hypothetical protein
VSRVLEPDVLCALSDESTAGDGQSVASDDLAPELQKILVAADVEMSSEQKLQVENLLKRKRDVLGTADKLFGRTELVQHEINTESSSPVKQRVRRPPTHMRKEAETEVQKMLDADVIEPSNSPRASPVVLVRKKDGV